jgi:hypothetical protein
MTDLRYPIGKLETPETFDAALRRRLIADIGAAPALLREAVAGLLPAQLDTRYRDGGWTVRQVVHHLPDSHMNGVTRFKLALTEERPTIRTSRRPGGPSCTTTRPRTSGSRSTC